MRVTGLGYEAEFFTFDGKEVVHAAVGYVDPLVRANAPVWLPHIAPTPLCGLGYGFPRQRAATLDEPLCRACHAHLRELDEWVRQAEGHLDAPESDLGLTLTHNRVHAMPF